MGYIQELRALVGNRPLIMVGATVLVLDQQDRLLFLKRADNGCWGVPGGGLEPGESLEETARRETLEETGLTIGEMQLFGVFSGPELFYRYPNGAQVHNVSVVYITRDVCGELRIDPDEHTEYRYLGLENIPEPLSPPIRLIIKRFVEAHSEGEYKIGLA